MVTYRASPDGSLIYTVLSKKFQKQSKRGYPLFLSGNLLLHLIGGCVLEEAGRSRFFPPWAVSQGGKATSASLLEYTPPN